MKNNCCQEDSKQKKDLIKIKQDLDVLNDLNRLRILCLINKHKEICVCDIQNSLNLSQNLVSYHLAKLKNAGFVSSKKQGVKVIYKQGEKKIRQFQNILTKLFTK